MKTPTFRLRVLAVLLLLAFALPSFAGHVRVTIRAYCTRGQKTATGTYPHNGTCAGPRKWLGCYVRVPNKGVYKVTDVCRSGIDLWMPTRQACRNWGRRTMTVYVARPKKRH